MTIDDVVQGKFEDFTAGDITPLDAANAIQEIVGPVSGYKYKPNSLTISNCVNRYSIKLRESGRKFLERVEEFKAALRIVARGNGRTQIEDHNGKGCSTKHYAREFWDYAHQVEAAVEAKYGSA